MSKMKDLQIGLIETLCRETGYDYEFLERIFWERMEDSTYDTTEEKLKDFIAITLERDW